MIRFAQVEPPSKLTAANRPGAAPSMLVTMTTFFGFVGLTAMVCSDSLVDRWLTSTLSGVVVAAPPALTEPAVKAAVATRPTARNHRCIVVPPSAKFEEPSLLPHRTPGNRRQGGYAEPVLSLDREELVVAGATKWRAWLEKHHSSSDGVWLVLAKKGTLKPTSLTYAQALEEALCFGWIDGQGRSRDAATFTQGFSPRRKRSPWSKRNTGIAERLVAEGRMHTAGVAEMDRAKADGRWEAAYAGPAAIEVPPELAAALAASRKAKAMFATLNSQ